MSGAVESEAPRPRPLSGGLWTLFSWLRRDEQSSSSESLSSAGSDRTVASFAFLTPAHYSVAAAPIILPPPGPPTDTYKKRVRERNLRRQHDRDLTLHRKYGLYRGDVAGGYDAFSLPSARRLVHSNSERQDRERRATSESLPRRAAYVPGKRRAPSPPGRTTATRIASSVPHRHSRKRRAPQPPGKIKEKNKENLEIVVGQNKQMSRSVRNKNTLSCDVSMGCKSEKYIKKTEPEAKLKQDRTFFTKIFENKKRHSAIETSSVKILPSISELDKQAAEIIETCKTNAIEPTSILNMDLKKKYLQASNTSSDGRKWLCITCARFYDASVTACSYCLVVQKPSSSTITDNSKNQTIYTQTESEVQNAQRKIAEAEEKKKLKEMLKEMKDSLPKKSKQCTKEQINITPVSNLKLNMTEAPTLRIGSSSQHELQNMKLEPSSSNKISAIVFSDKNDDKNVKKNSINMSANSGKEVLLRKNSDELRKIVQGDMRKVYKNDMEEANEVTNKGKREDNTEKTEKLLMKSSRKENLHVPLKISSLLNPIYISKQTASSPPISVNFSQVVSNANNLPEQKRITLDKKLEINKEEAQKQTSSSIVANIITPSPVAASSDNKNKDRDNLDKYITQCNISQNNLKEESSTAWSNVQAALNKSVSSTEPQTSSNQLAVVNIQTALNKSVNSKESQTSSSKQRASLNAQAALIKSIHSTDPQISSSNQRASLNIQVALTKSVNATEPQTSLSNKVASLNTRIASTKSVNSTEPQTSSTCQVPSLNIQTASTKSVNSAELQTSSSNQVALSNIQIASTKSMNSTESQTSSSNQSESPNKQQTSTKSVNSTEPQKSSSNQPVSLNRQSVSSIPLAAPQVALNQLASSGSSASPSYQHKPVVDINNINHHTRRRDLINQLEQSIAKGDERAAAEAATKLAQLRLSCSVLSFSSQILGRPSMESDDNSNNSKVVEIHRPQEKQPLPMTAAINHTAVPSLETPVSKESLKQIKSVKHDTCCKKNEESKIKPEPSTSHSNENKKSLIENPRVTTRSVLQKNVDEREELISISVWIEDKEAARGPIKLRIRRRALLGDLRREAEASLGLGRHLQRWIVGRNLCNDDNIPLVSLAGPDLNVPFYLCLVENDAKAKSVSPVKEGKQNDKAGDVYTELMQLEHQPLVTNADEFECGVCMERRAVGQGAVLRDCVHSFCRECLADMIRHCDEPAVPCPAMGCPGVLLEREVRALVSPEDYERWLARGLAAAESGTRNAFHCRTRDCTGWALCEPGVRRFPCPVCKCTNCVPCQAIHEGETCDTYRAKLQQATSAEANHTDEGTRALIESLISRGEALECPECSAIITKKWGCDWVKCSACKTEICWVTRGRRWGPGGRGDTSGGCRCGVDGKRCHPSCGYCH